MYRTEAETKARRRANKTGRTWYVVYCPWDEANDSGPYQIGDDEDLDTFWCGIRDENIALACEPE